MKNYRKNILITIVTIGILIFVFRNLVLSPVNLGGDFAFVNYEHFRLYSQIPYVWDIQLNNGFGQYTLFTLPFFWYGFLASKITQTINNPFILHKIILLIPQLLIGLFSIYYLAKTVLKSHLAQALTVLLYLTNPYYLMLISGGQLGVTLAYTFAPLAVALALKINAALQTQKPWPVRKKLYLISALSISVLIAFDSRMALLIVSAIVFLFSTAFILSKDKVFVLKEYLLYTIICTIVVLGFHSYWILPSLLIQSVALPSGYGASANVEFFSFTRFAHALGWMHPNYPDNQFGVVKEISGLVLAIPLLAFLALRKTRKITVYFALIALMSSFLAKGTNPPFGEIYTWLFNNVPAFNWFRDSTKFLLPLSIAYSILVGLTIQNEIPKLESVTKQKYEFIVLSISVIIIAIIWWPTFSGQINGTLAYRTYPAVHNEITKVLNSDKSFSRVLWIPEREMYGYTDLNHPAVSLRELRAAANCNPVVCITQREKPIKGDLIFTKEEQLQEVDQLMSFFTDPYTQEIFTALNIGYVILAPDVDKTIFLYDRKYDFTLKQYYSDKISSINWLEKQRNIEMYKTKQQGALIVTSGTTPVERLKYTMENPTSYKVQVTQKSPIITFNQTYNSRWILEQKGTIVYSTPNKFGMNEFPSDMLEQGEAKIKFRGQEYANLGQTISLATIALTLGLIIIIHTKQKKL